MEQQAYSQQHVPCINPQQRDNVMHLTFPLPVPATDNMDQERLSKNHHFYTSSVCFDKSFFLFSVLAKYEEQRNRVLLVSGVCFLLCLVTLPTIYLFFSDQFDGDSPNIMYIPMVLLVAYPLVIQSILTVRMYAYGWI